MLVRRSLALARFFNSSNLQVQARWRSQILPQLTHQHLNILYKSTPAPSPSTPRNLTKIFTKAITMDAQQLSHTQSMDELSALLSAIGIEKVPQQPNTHPALNPVDIYRSHITELLAPVAGVDPKIVYNALQWTNTLDKGDLVLAAPALRLKGKKPDELATDLAAKVNSAVLCLVLPNTDHHSSPSPHSSSHQPRTNNTSNSSSSLAPSLNSWSLPSSRMVLRMDSTPISDSATLLIRIQAGKRSSWNSRHPTSPKNFMLATCEAQLLEVSSAICTKDWDGR